MDKLISVIIPVYKPDPKWFRECVESILNQTYPDVEIIIVSKGEPEIGEILDNEILEKESVHHFRRDDLDIVGAINKGLEESNGELIAPISSDDYWEEDKLEIQMRYIEEGFDAVFTKAQEIDSEGDKIGEMGVFPEDNQFKKLLSRGTFACWESSLLKKDLVEEGWDQDLSIVPDLDLWIRIWDKAEIKYIDDYLVYKRRHPDNASKNLDGLYRDRKLILEKYNDKLESQDLKTVSWINLYRGFGKRFYENGEKNKARKLWVKALNRYPFELRSIMLLMSSLTPGGYYAANKIYSSAR